MLNNLFYNLALLAQLPTQATFLAFVFVGLNAIAAVFFFLLWAAAVVNNKWLQKENMVPGWFLAGGIVVSLGFFFPATSSIIGLVLGSVLCLVGYLVQPTKSKA